MTTFHKDPLNIEQQVDTLLGRGLVIDDRAFAKSYLSNISYFRLSAYTRPFYIPESDPHQFRPGTTFDDVLTLYTCYRFKVYPPPIQAFVREYREGNVTALVSA